MRIKLYFVLPVSFLIVLVFVSIFLLKVANTVHLDPNAYPDSIVTNNELTDRELIRTDPRIVGILYNYMKVTDEIFTKFNITYWAHGGTILGQVRHGGIIPWDDDIDIQLAPEEELKITVEVKNEFKKRGLSIQDFDLFGFKIAQINSPILDSAKKNWISIDVYISMKEKDVISLQKSDARKIWPLSYLYIDEIFPLKRVSFGPITIISINTPENHLSRRYGIDWKSYAFRLYVHATDSYMKPVKVKLETFSPADFSGFNY